MAASRPDALKTTGPSAFGWLDLAPILIVLVGLALMVAFDLGTPLPFNDEWMYQWVVRRFVEGHGFHLFPGQAPLALVQLWVGILVSVKGVDPHMLRLTAIPFVAATALALHRLALDLGANRFYAGVAAAAPVAIPLYAATLTGWMTEPYYLALLMLAALAGCRWLDTGRGTLLTLALCVLATLQRQQASALAPALTLGLLLASRRRTVAASEWGWLAVTWVAVLGALALPAVAGLQTAMMRDSLALLLHPAVAPVVASVLYLPGMTGLGALAFGGALMWRGQPGAIPWWRRRAIPVAFGVGVLVVVKTYVLPGNYLTVAGLNPITVAGSKPDLYGAVMPALKVLCVLAFVALAARPFELWPVLKDPRGAFLLALGGLALVPLLDGDVFDRYYLGALLPWLPLAATLSRESRWALAARVWALGVLVAGLGVYAIGEQDYQAWQVARATAELRAVQTVPASDVFSGFEPYAVDVVLPAIDRTGRLPPYANRHATTLEAPAHPRLVLLIEPPGDTRPGVPYSSLSPGKIVLVCVDPAGCL